jgi:hypothetical protein
MSNDNTIDVLTPEEWAFFKPTHSSNDIDDVEVFPYITPALIQADNTDIPKKKSVFNLFEESEEEQADLSSVGVCSGFGAYHTDNEDSKNKQSYELVVFDTIKKMIDNPKTAIDKDKAQWIIPSIVKSRVHAVHKGEGDYLYLWGDVDYKHTTDCKTIKEVGLVVSSITGGADFEIWTTRSATLEKQKCRILIRLEKLLTSREWLNCQELLFKKLDENGVDDDPATLRYGQVCYLPNPGKFYDSDSVRNGQFFDPLKFWSGELKDKEATLKAEEKEIKAKVLESKIQRENAYIEVIAGVSKIDVSNSSARNLSTWKPCRANLDRPSQ